MLNKKILLIGTICLLSFASVACGPEEVAPTPTPEPTPTPTPLEFVTEYIPLTSQTPEAIDVEGENPEDVSSQTPEETPEVPEVTPNN